VAVVFDGAPEPHFPDGSAYRGIKVFYSERGSNADERIKRIVDGAKERRTLLVVTSDRELATYVRRCGVKVMRSGDFRKRLEEVPVSDPSPLEDQNRVEQHEVPEWMRYFGVDASDEK
jgi:predicted RNA-binding protein with PIN domain